MIDVALRIASQFAPGLIGRLAGDKAENVARSVLSLGGLITGVDHTANPEAVAAALEADAEKAHQFRMQAAQIELELARLDHQNTADARVRDAKRAELGLGNTRADVLAYGAMIGLVAILALILLVTPGDDFVTGVISTVVGVLASALRDVFNFEFGSSRGSKNKESQLDRLINGDAP